MPREIARSLAFTMFALSMLNGCARNWVIQAPTPQEIKAVADEPGACLYAYPSSTDPNAVDLQKKWEKKHGELVQEHIEANNCTKVARTSTVQFLHADYASAQAYFRNLMLTSQTSYKRFGGLGLSTVFCRTRGHNRRHYMGSSIG